MNLKELQKQIKAFAQETKKRNEAFFKEAVKSVFEEHPNVQSFSWTQYTPYFNDGDACEFSANVEDYTLNTVDGQEFDCSWSIEQKIKKLKNSPAINAALEVQIESLEQKKKLAAATEDYAEAERCKKQIESLRDQYVAPGEVESLEKLLVVYKSINEILCAFDKDSFKMLFGDHVQVTVSKDSINVEEYNHD
jgi:hypothetical protein